MSLLEALGVDHTIFIQFGLFAVAFFTLTFGLFRPYMEAFEKREEITRGGEDLAVDLAEKAAQLRTQYETRARELTGEIKTIFDSFRDEAHGEVQKILSKARSESHQLIEKARNQISVEVAGAREKMGDEIPVLSREIVSKLLAKKV